MNQPAAEAVHEPGQARIAGILLAAGSGTRFAPDGARNKLLQRLPDGDTVVAAAARNMLAALPDVLAVVRPGSGDVAELLSALGCTVTVCDTAQQGMGASLVHALRQTQGAGGWIVGLGDMPYVRPQTIAALAGAVRRGAGIAAPVHEGRRGNPVGFGRAMLPHLLALGGDAGARQLLASFPVTAVAVNDPGTGCDIDTPADLEQGLPASKKT